MSDDSQVFFPFRLVASYADGSRLLFDGLTGAQAQQAMEAAQDQHGDITWWGGVTDQHYEDGRYWRTLPPPPDITFIDLTDYPAPQD